MTKVDLAQQPYFDDYNEDKKYYRILFRPGRAVQTRELTQLQTMLQKQVERLGSHIFEQGAQVIPGSKEGVKYVNNNGWIKIPRGSQADNSTQLTTYWMGKIIKSTSGPLGIKAQVIGFREPDSIDEARLYLNYLSADTAGTQLVFLPGQTIQTDEASFITSTIASSNAVGKISSVIVEEGVYFFNGNFVLVDPQTVFLIPSDPEDQTAWTNNPTCLAGLTINEVIVNSAGDTSLLENSLGSPNLAAPGADRLRIDAVLTQKAINATDSDFIPLLRVVGGTVQYRVVQTDYSILEDTLARRTNDESGNYAVRPFITTVKDFLRTDTNGGVHPEEEFWYATAPEAKDASMSIFGLASPGESSAHPTEAGVFLPGDSFTRFNDLCDAKLSLKIDPGKAYVQGYEIEKINTSIVDIDRARTLKYREGKTVFTPLGTFLYVSNMFGTPTLQAYDLLELHSVAVADQLLGPLGVGTLTGDGTNVSNSDTVTIGTKVYTFQTSLTNVDGNVLIAGTAAGTLTNLFHAINASGGTIGTDYALATTAHPTVTATNPSGTTVVVTAKTVGQGTLIPTTETSSHLSWGATTLTGYTRIGTARALSVEFYSGTNGTNGIYRLFLFDIRADDGKDLTQIKSIYSGSPTFTCDCVLNTFRLTGSVTKGSNLLTGTGTGWKNDQSERLTIGDYVKVSQGPLSKIYKITANPSNDNQLSVSPDPSGHTWLDGATIDYLYVLPEGNAITPSLIYKLPDEIVYTIRGGSQGAPNSSLVKTIYTSKRVIADGSTNSSSNAATNPVFSFTLTDPNESFANFSPLDYIVIRQDTGEWLQLVPYSAGTPATNTAEVQPGGATLNVYFSSAGGYGSKNYYVLGSVVRSNGDAAKEKAKTLVAGSFSGGVYTGPAVVTTNSQVATISLAKADALRVTRIVMAPDFSTVPSALQTLPAGHKDITGAYELDNGQRDYYYDIASITLRAGSERPTGRIRVEFDYFTHGNAGNYFSVDSYPFKGGGANMDYGEIPLYNSAKGGQYDLVSCVDFRPRVSEPNGIDGGFSTQIEVPRDNFVCDYHFYESRVDKLYLDRSGKFLVKQGVPNVQPLSPSDPETGMTIYELFLRAYTATSQDCVMKMITNRRYTMKDIGKLETRLKNLEYYTQLTLQEKQTKDLSIKDALGNDKFKNGYFVDNFGSFKGCDLGSLDFKAALDTREQEARPIIYESNVALFEKNLLEPNTVLRDQDRADSHYQKTGDIFTLPYDPILLVSQPKASKVTNVNPYAVFTYVGVVDVTPWSDEWRDTNNLEPLTIQDQSAFDAVSKTFGPEGTKISYGATINNWTGLSVENTTTGAVKLLIAGHSDVRQVRKDKQAVETEKVNQAPIDPNKGSTGLSTQNGPGRPAVNSLTKSGRQIIGGYRGGEQRKK